MDFSFKNITKIYTKILNLHKLKIDFYLKQIPFYKCILIHETDSIIPGKVQPY